MFWRLDALLRLLLECVNDPDFVRKLDSINDAKRIAAVRERDLQHARTETVQGLGNVRLSAFRRDCERTEEYASGPFGKLLKIFECRLSP